MRQAVFFLACLFVMPFCMWAQIGRHDAFITSDPGVRIFVREVSNGRPIGQPVLLIHGARIPGLASFDLPVKGGSLATDLTLQGFAAYVMDVRGYGASTRPKEMDGAPELHEPLVRSDVAARDIGAVVDWIQQRTHRKPALFGWATGGQWAGFYAAHHPERISHLVLLNSLYGGSDKHAMIGHGTDSEDPQHPGRFNVASCGAYRLNTEASLFGAWERSIPLQDKDTWRDPGIKKAVGEAALQSDPTSGRRSPPSFRSPCGALEDSFYLATGRELWSATFITAPTLVIASERDFWSRQEDREALRADLVHSTRVEVVVIPDATHFVHLDRPEHGRKQLLNVVSDFLKQ